MDTQEKAVEVYLKPLVEKHELEQVITYEDLVESWKAVEALLANQMESDLYVRKTRSYIL
jgi:hypothetical protein